MNKALSPCNIAILVMFCQRYLKTNRSPNKYTRANNHKKVIHQIIYRFEQTLLCVLPVLSNHEVCIRLQRVDLQAKTGEIRREFSTVSALRPTPKVAIFVE